MSKKISQMTDGSPAQGGDEIPIVRSGANLRVSATSVAALASSGGFTTSGAGFFYGPGLVDLITHGNATSGTICDPSTQVTVNTLRVRLFNLFASYKVSAVGVSVFNPSTSGDMSFGIYDLNGNKLLDATLPFDSPHPTPRVTLSAPVILPPGPYYFACSATTTGVYCDGLAVSAGTYASEQFALPVGGVVRVGYASNQTVANVMPATLGTITTFDSSTTGFPATWPMPIFLT
jgi:hypothetical protein